MKKFLLPLLVIALLMVVLVVPAMAKQYKIATVVKVDGIAWFERMREGVKKFAEDTGHEAFLVGPPKADAALQVQIIEDLIAQGVDAICVVPFSPEAVEPVLKRAMDEGIVVITHEASNIQNAHWDLEAFDNLSFGAKLMDYLAEYMGGEGEYATMVGSLTSKTHMEWITGSVERQKEKYPNMKLVTETPLEDYDDQTRAYENMKELLRTYPNLKGVRTAASTAAPGCGLAIEEAGLQDKIAVVGTSLVSLSGQYLESGAIKMIAFWDPADAGYAMNKLAVAVLEGKEVGNGTDLGVPGYTNLRQDGRVLYGEAWVFVAKENMDKYNF
ncbi:MAG: autoinducer 2 ABC transporter substrate-binding protein [Candidatus Atribacteria bacterium]|nr:autoinducer 2 ABC transporter substrate-binding protein [Candidatus Atribacteria bacterium]